jgi:hypothetical protein
MHVYSHNRRRDFNDGATLPPGVRCAAGWRGRAFAADALPDEAQFVAMLYDSRGVP